MSDKKKTPQGLSSGHQSVSNLPPDAAETVSAREVSLPATQGANPNAATPTAGRSAPLACAAWPTGRLTIGGRSLTCVARRGRYLSQQR